MAGSYKQRGHIWTFSTLVFLVVMLVSIMQQACLGFDNTHLFEDAAAGDPEAQYTLAHLYYKGRGGVAQSIPKAALWFHKASDSGHRDAMYYLAILLLDRNSGIYDSAEAIQWLQKSAALGQTDACYALGRAYGLATQSGIYWLQRAASKGYRPAMEFLDTWCETVPSACR